VYDELWRNFIGIPASSSKVTDRFFPDKTNKEVEHGMD
jgi:hypothetical protein